MKQITSPIIPDPGEIEVWKDIRMYKGKYQISSFGNVKSLERIVIGGGGHKRTAKGRILKSKPTNKGYLRVFLFKNSISRKILISRLVCTEFHKNPFNKPQVNHKDGIKTNNYYKNLEWSTQAENMTHAYKNNLHPSLKGRTATACGLSWLKANGIDENDLLLILNE